MGKGFGNLYYMRNIVFTRVSSYEQKAFGNNFFKTSIINLFNEVKFHAPFILPPAALSYLGITWAMAERERAIRKDPKLYQDDDDDE